MRNIKRNENHEDLVRQLTEATDAGRPVFPTMRELMCFAAVLGYENKKRMKLGNKTHDIDARIWERSQQAMDLVYLIALVDQQDGEILRDEREDDALGIFEEYANGGLDVLAGWMKEKPDDLNGDRAILAALSSYGFLSDPSVVGGNLSDAEF